MDQLRPLRARHQLTDLDIHFADLMGRLAGEPGATLLLAAALCSHATGEGHVCLQLGDLAGQLFDDSPQWRQQLMDSGVVGPPGSFYPLILDPDGRLYLYRYWDYESRLAQELLQRSRMQAPAPPDRALKSLLERLFPPAPGLQTNWQKVAAATALLRNFTLVSGGPGTGKTSVVVRILALLQAQAGDAGCRIALAAPTGKAAARLQESISRARDALPLEPASRQQIPDQAVTLHRLLGMRSNAAGFRHDRNNPLPLDALILDEASMVDVALMSRLLQALPRQARLILLGDRHQLSSVEAGAVLGDICGDACGFSPAFRATLQALTGEAVPAGAGSPGPLSDSIVFLQHSFRFTGDSGIGRLSDAIRQGDSNQALALLQSETDPTLRLLEETQILPYAIAGFADYLRLVQEGGAPERVFEAFRRFRILTALRRGPQGAQGLNQALERAMTDQGLLRAGGDWYSGRPVMILQNDYNLRLYNGDIGILLGGEGAAARVCFPAADGSIRRVAPSRLPLHETAFAMTVHKSQGSEFERVLLLLPELDLPLISRELIYTAVTRARREFLICGPNDVLRAAVQRRTRRSTGLRDALWRP